MKASDIPHIRLINQRFVGEKFKKSEEVVNWLGAVQSQDYPAAKWSLGLRTKNSTDKDIEKAFNEGKILRTHIMLPTWHFVSPSDIRWMLELTTPRVRMLLAYYDKKLEIDEKLRSRTNKIIRKKMEGGNFLTRSEITVELAINKIIAKGQRLGHLVMHMELDGIICSGPLRGKQFTYALLEERVPILRQSLGQEVKKLTRDEALSKLTLKYFQSHGPAQLKDFSWWSGLTLTDTKEGVGMIKSKFEREIVDGKEYWFSRNSLITYNLSPTTYFLSVYDEYFIGYKDRSLILDEKHSKNMAAVGNALLTSLIIINGKVEGTWKRIPIKDKVEIKLNPFRKFERNEKELLDNEVTRYGKFLGIPEKKMIEKHPYGNFVPIKARYLLLGSFVAKPVDGYDWFYGTKRNQFWPILEVVYKVSLKTKKDQQKLFTKLRMAITDIILKCEREKNSNLDVNLKKIVFNTKAIQGILVDNKIEKIYFTSRFVEKLFRKEFKKLIHINPEIELLTLPSPSPRYAQMTKEQKISKYKKLLPK